MRKFCAKGYHMTTTTRAPKQRSLTFFFWFNAILCVIIFSAFTLRALLDTDGLPPMRLSLIVHAVTSALWMLLVPLQSWLVSTRRLKIHRPLGWASVGLAISVVLSGIVISIEFYDRTTLENEFSNPGFDATVFGFTFGGVLSVVLFGICYTAALVRLRDIAFHKRMMTFASVFIFPPAFNRLVFAFDWPLQVTNISFLFVLAALPIYDRRTEGNLTRASKAALVLFVANAITMAVATAAFG